jgi:hypothetical protein
MAADPASQLHPFEHSARVPVLGQELQPISGCSRGSGLRNRRLPGESGLTNGDAQRDRPARRAVLGRHEVRDGDMQVQLVTTGLAGPRPQRRADRGRMASASLFSTYAL